MGVEMQRDREKKKEYRTPELEEHGALKDLTTGGSGNAQETSMGQRPRP